MPSPSDPPLLFTSLPPRLRGIPLASLAADALHVRVVRSWREAGYRPVSINTAVEHVRHPHLRDAIEALGVEAVIAPTGGPGTTSSGMRCSLRAFLEALGARAQDGPIAITNADIEFTCDERMATAVATLGCDEQLLGQRVDVHAERGGREHVSPYLGGFDFFACHCRALKAASPFLAPSLVIGLPWWDHFLPLSLAAVACRPRMVPLGAILHRSHTDRWHERDYCSVGLSASRHFANASRECPPTQISTRWLSVYESLTGPGLASTRLDRVLRQLFARSRPLPFVTARTLQGIAAANVALLLQAAAQPEATTLSPPAG